MNNETLNTIAKDKILSFSRELTPADVSFLVQTLKEKDDKLRYNAFLLLQALSREKTAVYPHWGELEKKLDSDNSYQRSLGVMLLSENVRWDNENQFAGVLGKYLRCCQDEKFITARQAIQGLAAVVKATDKYNGALTQGLANLQLAQYKENQQKLLKKDIANISKLINK